jgi:flagellar hook-associated protein 3 FlgL
MRLSTANTFDANIDALNTRRSDLARTQLEISSGKRIAVPSDDPSAMARAERALGGIQRSDIRQRAVDSSKTAMTLSEQALGDATTLLQSVRETLVSAGTATISDSDRQTLADKLRSMRSDLLAVANRSDGAGSYLFGGQGADQPPFIDAPSGVQYTATPGSSTLDANAGLALSTNGQAAWMRASTGNGVFVTQAAAGVKQAWIDAGQVTDPSAITGDSYSVKFSVASTGTTYAVLRNGQPTSVTAAAYSDGQSIAVGGLSFAVHGTPAQGDQFSVSPSTPTLSVFGAIDKAISDLSQPGKTGAQRSQDSADNLRNVDAVMAPIQSARTVAGQALARIDGETSRLADLKLNQQSELSDAQDTDLTQSISSLQSQQTGYQAALQSYAMVQKLSLFQYLNG